MEEQLPNVKDVCNRGVLCEGRNYQMGFAFCKLLESGDYETVQPLSPCKDYLNDVVYSELTGKEFSACGLKTKKNGIFNTDHAYLAIKILPGKGGGWYIQPSLNDSRDVLRANYKNIEKLINHVEELFDKYDCVDRTIITPTKDKDMFLLAVPVWWVQSTHLISLYSLLVRMAQFWDGKGSPDDYLENYNNPLDKSLWKPTYVGSRGGAYNRYKYILEKGIKIIHPKDLGGNVHNSGILSYKID